ncbi:carboxypeptidase M32 [Tuberibacillus sp. Marseille-P3662]|uniref:carboxypeptidase M32 n=1 Tax=Tuberibacillus sp. Marseille-P3662 TaxID=1965358 RepID=UPI000A1C8DB9|nr:carboxypeptidase M32 [Tuberibacillus sp. Marseille-P3662]
MANIREIEQQYFDYVNKLQHYEEASGVLNWDLRTGAPKKGVEQRSEVIGTLSETIYNMQTSDQMKAYLDALETPDVQSELSDITKRSVAESRKDYNLNVKIPANEFKEYVILQSKSENVWEEAKEKSDFSLLQPYLEKLVEFKKRFADYWEPEGSRYDALLDMFEPGVKETDIDRVFNELREHITPLVQAISEAGNKPETQSLQKSFPAAKQRAFSEYILNEMGYDFAAGRLDETSHPFATGLNRGDVRVTTNYNENDFRLAVFGTIHEGGHALYEQNIGGELEGTPLAGGTSMGIHESQSLFFENFVGRSYGFWKRYYDDFKTYTNGQFNNMGLDDFYRSINVAGPSFIRIEADELTYPLHIIVRFELERALFRDEITVADLPGLWNEKMAEYLGIRPQSDREGVLQDIHWSGGEFGYFPSYALGYLYAAQFKHTMDQEIDVEQHLEKGNIAPVREWLTQHIHQYGAMKKPKEILRDVTGEPMNAKYLINYLTNKYKGIYQL